MAEPQPRKRLASAAEVAGVVHQLVDEYMKTEARDCEETRMLAALGVSLERLSGEKLVQVWLAVGQVLRLFEDAAWPKQGKQPTQTELAKLARLRYAFSQLDHTWFPKVTKELGVPPFSTRRESEDATV